MGQWGTTPVSSVNVTCIPKQYLVLGQLGSSPLARDQDGKWEGELPDAPCLFRVLLTLGLYAYMALCLEVGSRHSVF